jgi:ribose/xylose/arabinose/galactoside ABC-type transport system permease subunit
LRLYGLLLVALVIEFAFFEAVSRYQDKPSFLSPGSLVNILNRSAVYGVISVGMTFVILTGGIDLAVGSMIALGSVLCAKTVLAMGEPIGVALLVAYAATLLAGATAGGVAGLFITRFGIPPFIATLALMSSARGLASIITSGKSIAPMPDAYMFLGRHRVLEAGGMVGIPVAVLVMVCVFVAGAIVLNYTRFGRHVRAIGGNTESARLSGVPVARVMWTVYVMSSVLAVVGAILASSRLGAGDPDLGMGDELGVIAAVVVGGTSLSGGRGSIEGTFVGLLLIAVLASGLNWIGVESFTQQLVLGVVILAAVMLDRLRPQG